MGIRRAGRQAVRHLLQLGHTRIGYAHHSPVYGMEERKLALVLENCSIARTAKLLIHYLYRGIINS